MNPLRLVFVCSGNICRSPMAEGMTRAELARQGLAGKVISMGTLGIVGRSASGFAVEVCRDNGIDIDAHRSQGISRGILARADMVLVMEQAHREFLERGGGPMPRNLRLLSEFDSQRGPMDIADPIGGPKTAYESCFARLERCIGALVEGLLQSRS